MRARWLTCCLVVVAVAAASGCGGGGGAPSDEQLRDRLVPSKEVGGGFKFHRAFIWDNAIDLTFQGLNLSQNSTPSAVVKAIDDAHFVKGAGEEVQLGVDGPGITVVVLKFKSSSGASDIRDVLHTEDRKQPCYGVCTQVQRPLDVKGIPGATAVASVPDPNAGPNVPPGFDAAVVEFAIGPYLYGVGGGGPPNSGMKERVVAVAHKLYARVKDRPA